MTKIAPIDPKVERPGNTKQVSMAVKWCFTLNNFSNEEYKQLQNCCVEKCKYYIIGKEVGESGTPHLQGFIQMEKKFRPSELKLSKRIHWEKAKGDKDQNYTYCSKDGNFITNMEKPLPKGYKGSKNMPVMRKTANVTGIVLRPWQQFVWDLLSEKPDNRTVHWFWDNGNNGKTLLTKMLVMLKNAIILDGSRKGILHTAGKFPSNIYIYDLERTMEDKVPYSSIEKIKNGLYVDEKYEGAVVCEDSPHIIIFANFKPDKTALSKDRWNIVNIDKWILSDVAEKDELIIVNDVENHMIQD